MVDKYIRKVIAHRGISEKTYNRFGVATKFEVIDGVEQPDSTGFPYPNGAIKVRGWNDKTRIFSTGDMGSATLFLKNYFDKSAHRCITLTEGEYDALAAAQILQNESAVVSVRSSSSAVIDCKREWDYINSFEKIIVNFDNDTPGQEAAKKVLGLFDFKKTYNLCLERHKDANAYIWEDKGDYASNMIDEGKLYYEAWKSVRRHTPDNILSGNRDLRKALDHDREAVLGTWPTEDLQERLYGIHAGEVIILKAQEGIGKTSFFRFMEDHLLKTTKHPIGLIHLEEDTGTTLKGMAAYYSQTPVHIPNTHVSTDDIFKIIEKINGKDEGRIHLRSAFDVEDEDAFINGVRFLVSVCGCRFIFLDHISWLATGGDDSDERKKLDRIAQRLKLLAKELNFALIMISHVNDDGKTRGSRYISKVGNTVISISRDITHVDEVERSKTFIMIEKARLMGAKSGPAGYVIYDPELQMLKPAYRVN